MYAYTYFDSIAIKNVEDMSRLMERTLRSGPKLAVSKSVRNPCYDTFSYKDRHGTSFNFSIDMSIEMVFHCACSIGSSVLITRTIAQYYRMYMTEHCSDVV